MRVLHRRNLLWDKKKFLSKSKTLEYTLPWILSSGSSQFLLPCIFYVNAGRCAHVGVCVLFRPMVSFLWLVWRTTQVSFTGSSLSLSLTLWQKIDIFMLKKYCCHFVQSTVLEILIKKFTKLVFYNTLIELKIYLK